MGTATIEARLPGRDAELEALCAALAEARSGRTAAVALVGEAGIGKSALLGAVRDRAEGLLVLDGRAGEHERDVPFGLAVDLLDDAVAALHPRRLDSLGADRLAELAPVLPAVARQAEAIGDRAADRFHAHRALRALLELLGGQRPLAILLDDLHWADAASLELASHLLRRPPRVAHLLVLAFRPVAAVATLLDALRSAPHARELHLGPLGREAALEVLADLRDPRLRDRLEHEAGGNPLFLRELARSAESRTGAGPIPRTVIAAVQREAHGVPPASRTLLDGAAVAGDPFDPELAAATAGIASGDAPGLLDHLVAADLVRPGSGPRSFEFRHPLVRRAVYDAAPPGWRLGAHERAAAALAARGASAAVRAYHVARCARPGDGAAIATLMAAGEGAQRTAPAAAVHWYEAARRLVAADDLAALAEADYRLMRALAAAGRTPEAIQVGTAALDRGNLPPGVSWCQFVEEVAGLEGMQGRGAAGRARIEAALAVAGPDPERVRLEVGRTLLAMPDGEEVRIHAVRALETLATLGPERAPMRAAVHAALALAAFSLGEPEVAAGETALAEDIVAATSDARLAERFGAIMVLSMALAAQERLADADAVFARAQRIERATSQGHYAGVVAFFRADVVARLGRIEEARELAEMAEDTGRLGGRTSDVVGALVEQAVCLDLADRWVEARLRAEEARRLALELPPTPFMRIPLARLAAIDAERDPERALAGMLEAAGPTFEVTGPSPAVRLMGVAVGIELALGREAAARGRVTAMRELAERGRLPVSSALADLAEARVRLTGGETDAAARLAARAADGAARAGAALDALTARIVGATAEGRIHELRDVAAEAERIGALRLRAEAARELRRLGQRIAPSSRPSGGARGLDTLTPREQEIAALVAGGNSNKQVALALHLSEKTIEKGLSRIYAKVGARSRVELATAVAAANGD